MSLTGTALPVTLLVLALALFAVVVLGVPRVRRRPLRVLTRAGEVLVLNALVLLLAGVLLNDQYDFYVSWADLFATGGVPTTVARGANAHEALAAGARGVGLSGVPVPTTLPPLPSPGQRLQTYTITGPASGVRGQVLVLLPPGYNPADRRTYPVIEAFHGFPSVPVVWLHSLHIDNLVDAAVQAHTMRQAIVVIPQINTPNWLDTECVNGTAGQGPLAETWLAKDVPEFAVSHFRVARTRDSWATIGYSYGGWCAPFIAMHHPDVFGGALSLEGYFAPEFAPNYVPFRPASPTGRRDDLITLARTDPPAIALWVMASKDDRLSYPSTAVFLKAVRPPTSLTVDLVRTGGHRMTVVQAQLPAALAWLGSALPGFAP